MSDQAPLNEAVLARMTEWIGAIADNVNNPVAGISAAIAILEKEVAAGRITGECNCQLLDDSLLRIRQRITALGEYVTELVELVRPTAPEPKKVDLRPVVNKLVAGIQTKFNVVPQVFMGEKAHEVFVDPQRIGMVLKALLTNSVEAALHGGKKPEVEIRIENVATQGVGGKSTCVISVEDNGPGFAGEAAVRGVEPFFSTKEAGTGLGLAVAQSFAKAHGGSLEFDRSPKLGGARVQVKLPQVER